jgi:hypothetical protein
VQAVALPSAHPRRNARRAGEVASSAAPLVGHEAGVVAALRVAEVAGLDVERCRAAIVFLDVLSGRVKEGQRGAAAAAPEVARPLERGESVFAAIRRVHEAQPFVGAGLGRAGEARRFVQSDRALPVAVGQRPGLSKATALDAVPADLFEEFVLGDRDDLRFDDRSRAPQHDAHRLARAVVGGGDEFTVVADRGRPDLLDDIVDANTGSRRRTAGEDLGDDGSLRSLRKRKLLAHRSRDRSGLETKGSGLAPR